MSELLNYLPLFLVLATLVTGMLWGHDRFRRRPQRLAAAAALDERTLMRLGVRPTKARAALLADPPAMEWGGSFFPLLALVLVVRSFLFEPFVIPSGSMLPTLEVGDYILVNKYRYGLRLPVLGTKVVSLGEPERGDVMVFYPPHLDSYYIKRVVGLPGDFVRYDNRTLFINGERVSLEAQVMGTDGLERFIETLGPVTHEIQYEAGRGAGCRSGACPRMPIWYLATTGTAAPIPAAGATSRKPTSSRQAVAIWMHKAPGLALRVFAVMELLSDAGSAAGGDGGPAAALGLPLHEPRAFGSCAYPP